MALAPDSAEPYNALGTLKAAEGKRAEAEQLYRQCSAKESELLSARHNLATAASWRKERRRKRSTCGGLTSTSRRIIFRRTSAWLGFSPSEAMLAPSKNIVRF